MSDKIEKPALGRRVLVQTGNYGYEWMNKHPRKPIEGIVAANHSWQAPNSFRLHPAFHGAAESIISMDRVISIAYVGGTQSEQLTVLNQQRAAGSPAQDADAQTWTVPGSKGQEYTVSRRGSQWSCTCIAGGFGRTCKHVKQISEDNSG